MSGSSAYKPIIGLAGGIGSGKSLVAGQMAELGGAVFDADAVAKQLLDDPDVRGQLVGWWGDELLDAQGRIDHRKLARIVFADEQRLRKLEGLIHPLVAQQRERFLTDAQADPAVKFIVLDVPLLFETGWDKRCDRVVFVKADLPVRLQRLADNRGWDAGELARREKSQWPLDKKQNMAHDVVDNNAKEADCRRQVRHIVLRFRNPTQA